MASRRRSNSLPESVFGHSSCCREFRLLSRPKPLANRGVPFETIDIMYLFVESGRVNVDGMRAKELTERAVVKIEDVPICHAQELLEIELFASRE
jgi:hypothetical protein